MGTSSITTALVTVERRQKIIPLEDYNYKWLFVLLPYVLSCVSYAYIDPWDMLHKFCFHVCAQKSLFIGENGNDFYTPAAAVIGINRKPPDPVTRKFIELVLATQLDPTNRTSTIIIIIWLIKFSFSYRHCFIMIVNTLNIYMGQKLQDGKKCLKCL